MAEAERQKGMWMRLADVPVPRRLWWWRFVIGCDVDEAGQQPLGGTAPWQQPPIRAVVDLTQVQHGPEIHEIEHRTGHRRQHGQYRRRHLTDVSSMGMRLRRPPPIDENEHHTAPPKRVETPSCV
jgi:hypothetical protein